MEAVEGALEGALDGGFAFVTTGRALLADPDFVVRMQRGKRFVSRCDHCVARMIEGVACVLVDSAA
ncbi:MAG: hypothetical protein SangKO_027860 [Sandaracinaceae bacterium]